MDISEKKNKLKCMVRAAWRQIGARLLMEKSVKVCIIVNNDAPSCIQHKIIHSYSGRSIRFYSYSNRRPVY